MLSMWTRREGPPWAASSKKPPGTAPAQSVILSLNSQPMLTQVLWHSPRFLLLPCGPRGLLEGRNHIFLICEVGAHSHRTRECEQVCVSLSRAFTKGKELWKNFCNRDHNLDSLHGSQVTGMSEVCKRDHGLWVGPLLPGEKAGPTLQVCPVLRLVELSASYTTRWDTVYGRLCAVCLCRPSECCSLLILCSHFFCLEVWLLRYVRWLLIWTKGEVSLAQVEVRFSAASLENWYFHPTQSIPVPAEAPFLNVPSSFHDWFCDSYIFPRIFSLWILEVIKFVIKKKNWRI